MLLSSKALDSWLSRPERLITRIEYFVHREFTKDWHFYQFLARHKGQVNVVVGEHWHVLVIYVMDHKVGWLPATTDVVALLVRHFVLQWSEDCQLFQLVLVHRISRINIVYCDPAWSFQCLARNFTVLIESVHQFKLKRAVLYQGAVDVFPVSHLLQQSNLFFYSCVCAQQGHVETLFVIYIEFFLGWIQYCVQLAIISDDSSTELCQVVLYLCLGCECASFYTFFRNHIQNLLLECKANGLLDTIHILVFFWDPTRRTQSWVHLIHWGLRRTALQMFHINPRSLVFDGLFLGEVQFFIGQAGRWKDPFHRWVSLLQLL